MGGTGRHRREMVGRGRGVNDGAVGPHIAVPLFDSGRRSGQIKTAAAQTEQARLAEQKLSGTKAEPERHS